MFIRKELGEYGLVDGSRYRLDGVCHRHRDFLRALFQAFGAHRLQQERVIAPYQDGTSLQFRVANARSNDSDEHGSEGAADDGGYR